VRINRNLFLLFLFAFLGTGIITHPRSSLAQGGPPMITDDPGTPGAGHWENNFAFTVDNTPTEHLYETPIADINYGWGDRVQLKIEIPWLVIKDPNSSAKTGIGNIDPGVKIRFLDEDSSGINLSTYPQYRLNYTTISSTLFGNQFFLPIEASRTFGELQLDAEVGFDFLHTQPGEWEYGVVAGYYLSPSQAMQLLAELHATSGTGMLTELMANLGYIIKISKDLNFLASLGKNLTPTSYNEFIEYVGLQLLIE
jgi:hypothetical protein